jgi:DNA-directed RNA polymerase subunit beta
MITTTTNPITSLGTGLIPFIEHNDANRALMGSNMQRQALPLLEKEVAQVSTGIETQVVKASQYTIIAKKSGIITFSNQRILYIKNLINSVRINQTKSNLNKYKTKIKKNNIHTFNWKLEKYSLKEIRKSNQNNYLQYTNLITTNNWIKKGQIINEGNGTHKGKLSIGRNIFVGYMSWEGYNFEDAIVVNKNLIDKNIFTSINTKREKIFLIRNETEEV